MYETELDIEEYTKVLDDVWGLLECHDIFRSFNDDLNFAALDARLAEIDAEQMHIERLVSYLRFSWRYKEHLPHWQPLLEASHVRIIQMGIDPRELLEGML